MKIQKIGLCEELSDPLTLHTEKRHRRQFWDTTRHQLVPNSLATVQFYQLASLEFFLNGAELFAEFSEFRENDKSLRHELGSI